MIGIPFLRRRKSSLINGAADDAAELTAHLAGHLGALAGRRDRRAP
jgi:putative flavoprotein involved in K+ transport